jgi:kumamolisin
MRPKNIFVGARVGLIAVLLGVALPHAEGADPAPVRFDTSIKKVASAPATGTANQHRPYISRTTLKAAESAAPMTFEVVLKMRNFPELQARVNSGERISTAEMAEKYEPLAVDDQTVAAWLKGEGFTVVRQSSRHLAIFVRGNVSQVAQSLKVNFARVTAEGKEYTSAVTAPSVPANIAPLLIAINGLQPHIHAHRHIVKTNASGGSGTSYTPAQIALAYQVTGLYNTGIDGTGQTIAIVIDAFPATSDLTTFWKNIGSTQRIGNVAFIQAVPASQSADGQDPVSGEETLDTEWSSAMAPAAKVRVYNSADLDPTDLDAAYQTVLDDVNLFGIHQMSMSYGVGELDASTGQILSDHQNYFMELANAGVSCFASSGDGGAYPNVDENNNPELEVEAPASDPSVTGVGGTTLMSYSNPNANTEVTWNSANTANFPAGATGGGASVVFDTPTYCPWQAVNGVPIGTMREVPDISCAADPNYGADYYFGGSQSVTGGTSWASPTCAAFCALINHARSKANLGPIGLLGPSIYPLIGSANFRDITMGNNYAYTAGPGYDETTGIGVPLVQTLATTFSATQTVSQSPFIATVNQGQNATIRAIASGSPVNYQWQVMTIGTTTWSPLNDGGGYSGSGTATLTIADTTTAMSGDQFKCMVTYAGGAILSSALTTTLIVETPWYISTLAGDAGTSGLVSNTGTAAEFSYPTGIAIDGAGNLYVTDLDNNVIRKVTPGGVVTTPYGSLAGTSGYLDASNNNALFDAPRDIAIDSTGSFLYVTDEGNELIRKITVSTGAVTTFAGTTSQTNTIFIEPRGIAVDHSGNVYVADSGNNVIRKITSGGTVSIFAGSSTFVAGYADGAGTTQALFNQPIGMAIDSSGNLYVADYGNEVVRKITSAGVVSTIAGQAGIAGCADGAAKTQALFNVPRGVTVDGSGNVYVTDSSAPSVTEPQLLYTGNDLLREISTSGVVTTLAGEGGIPGTTNANGSTAQFYSPTGLAMNGSTLYIADAASDTIRTAAAIVSISATGPIALANESIDGQFTVTRSVATASSLTVNYSVGGRAVNGTDYSILTGSVIIPAGASSATITVTPLSNPATNLTVILTVTGSSLVGALIDSTPATVTIVEGQAKTFSAWESGYTISSDPTSTPFNDDVPTLMKYLSDIDPTHPITAADRAALPTVGGTTIGSTSYLTLTYRQYAAATGLTVDIQTSPDLVNWTTVSNPTIIGIGLDPTTNDPILQAQVPFTTSPQFIRLNVALP